MRPALKAGLLPVWRDRDTVQIGIDPRRAVALTGLGAAAGLLRLLDGSRDRDQLIALAAEHGTPAIVTERVLTLLAAGGVLNDYPAASMRALSQADRDRLAAELATCALAHGHSDAGAAALARRSAARVRVHGDGRVAAVLADILASSGIAQVTVETLPPPRPAGRSTALSTMSRRRQTPGGNAPGSQTPGGQTPGGKALDRQTQGSLAPDRQPVGGKTPNGQTPGGPVPGGKALDILALGGQAPAGQAPGGPAPGSKTPGGQTPGRPRRPGARGAAETVPDLAILVGAYAVPGYRGRDLPGWLMQAGVPHLAVRAEEAIGVVGPLVRPGQTACLRCVNLTRAGLDPAWPLILAQLARQTAAPPACDAALAAMVAGQAASQVLSFLDQGGLRVRYGPSSGDQPRPEHAGAKHSGPEQDWAEHAGPEQDWAEAAGAQRAWAEAAGARRDWAEHGVAAENGTLEVELPGWQWRRRTWRPHPDCSCGAR